ncbi:MAG: AIR synthase-related protein, partial [Pseudomonadales bacterium]
MDQSNQRALDVLLAHGATAATDITGFGLLGHLAEMLQSLDLGVDLQLQQLPMFDGVADLLDAKVYSSLQAANRGVLSRYQLLSSSSDPGAASEPQSPPVQRWLELACDPQTSGGLLAALPADRARDCVQALRDAGYPAAADVGLVTASGWRLLLQSKGAEASN